MSPVKIPPTLKWLGEKVLHLYVFTFIALGIKGVNELVAIKTGLNTQSKRIEDMEKWRDGVNNWKAHTDAKLDSFNVFQKEQYNTDAAQDKAHYELAGEVHDIQDKLKKR